MGIKKISKKHKKKSKALWFVAGAALCFLFFFLSLKGIWLAAQFGIITIMLYQTPQVQFCYNQACMIGWQLTFMMVYMFLLGVASTLFMQIAFRLARLLDGRRTKKRV